MSEDANAVARACAQARESERRRIAADLHDGVGPDLAAVSLNLAAVEGAVRGNDAAVELVRDTRRLLAKSIAALREACGAMRPAELDRHGLAQALRELVERHALRCTVEATFADTGFDGIVGPDAALALYRIAQEALHNCAKHAAARRVRVTLLSVDGCVLLTVGDDGAGFDVSAHPPGIGLASMRDRMLSLGGSLQVDATPCGGTRVVAEVRRDASPA